MLGFRLRFQKLSCPVRSGALHESATWFGSSVITWQVVHEELFGTVIHDGQLFAEYERVSNILGIPYRALRTSG